MEMDFKALVSQIQSIDGNLKHEANKAVNTLLTIRNWMIGYYIVAYEQNGQDKGKYGDKILETLAENVDKEGLSLRNLRLFKQFFLSYPQVSENLYNTITTLLQFRQTVSAEFKLKNSSIQIRQTPSAEFMLENSNMQILQTLSAQFTLDNKNMQIEHSLTAQFEGTYFANKKLRKPIKHQNEKKTHIPSTINCIL